MRNSLADAVLGSLSLERGSVPLSVQLYQSLRRAMLEGRIAQASRLPASRVLAAELGVSRATVIAAYDQLAAEGYIEGRRGAGMFVVPDVLPDIALTTELAGGRASSTNVPHRRGERAVAVAAPMRPLSPHRPALESFPLEEWNRALARSWRSPSVEMCAGQPAAGHLPLRAAIAEHLAAARGIACEPAQVVITSGAGEALALVVEALGGAGGAAWMEEPGYKGIRAALSGSGMQVVPVPVDEQGFDVVGAQALAGDARLAVVTPARHYPLGIAMSAPRRMALLEWAASCRGWIVEDDYDSEYRYSGRPLAPLVTLDSPGRVLYLSSFSKVMFGALRLCYLVVPEAILAQVVRALQRRGARASMVAQPALADFMLSGGFAAHIRRMRRLYRERRDALVEALHRHCAGLVEAGPQDAGMNLVVELTPALAARMDDQEVARRAAAAGVQAVPLSSFYAGPPARLGLQLGFAGWSVEEIERAAAALGSALTGKAGGGRQARPRA